MQKRSRTPRDTNLLAHKIVQIATGEDKGPEDSKKPEKNPAAVELGRLGGQKGGVARKIKLSKTRRSEIARKAVNARWKKHRKS